MREFGYWNFVVLRTPSIKWPNVFSKPTRFLLAEPAKMISLSELFGILIQTL
jgi:hypothetical protein